MRIRQSPAMRSSRPMARSLGADEGVTEEGIIVKKGDKQMDEAVQKAVQKLMDDGTYQKILENWGVSSGAIDKAEINPTK